MLEIQGAWKWWDKVIGKVCWKSMFCVGKYNVIKFILIP